MKKKIASTFTIVTFLAGCSTQTTQPDSTPTDSIHTTVAAKENATSENNATAVFASDGSVTFKVTLASGQQYVEVFSRKNGIQNISQYIAGNEIDNHDGTTTYFLKVYGYEKSDIIEYRFYSYLPNSEGVFTPGPFESTWSKLSPMESVHIPVSKDATVYLGSPTDTYGDANFGSNPNVSIAHYHLTSDGMFGFSLNTVPTGKAVRRAELVFPSYNVNNPSSMVNIAKVREHAEWLESTITWNNAPAVGEYFPTLMRSADYGTAMDVTAMVQEALQNGEQEISFRIQEGNTIYLTLDSKENPSGLAAYLNLQVE